MRDRLLDTAKGLGSIFVIFGHIHTGLTNDILVNFRMPLFFFLSGAALLYSKSNGINIKKKLKALLVPYWIFSLFFLLYWWFVEPLFMPVGHAPIFGGRLGELPCFIQYLINIATAWSMGWAMAYDGALWFLPCMFVAVVSYVTIRKTTGKYAPILYVMCAVIYFIAKGHVPSFPFGVEIAATTLPLIWAGEKIYGKLRDMDTKKGILLATSTLLLSAVIFRVYYPNIDMHTHRFGVWWQFYILAISLIITFVLFCRLLILPKFNIVEWFGRSSIIVMSVHIPLIRLNEYLFTLITGSEASIIRYSLWMSIIETVIITLAVVPFIYVINKYLPFVIGRKRKVASMGTKRYKSHD